MPTEHHRSLAQAVIANAKFVHDEIAKGDVAMAHGYAILLSGQAEQLLRSLSEQLDAEAATDPVPGLNPYDVVHLSGPTTEDGLRRLSNADLLEYCRSTNWEREHTDHGMSRWWLSKAMSRAKAELRARRLDDEAWRDGTERE